MTDNWAQVEDGKGGTTEQGKAVPGSHEGLLGPTRTRGKRRRVVEAGEWGCRPGGRLFCARAIWGEEKRVQREREAASKGEILGSNRR